MGTIQSEHLIVELWGSSDKEDDENTKKIDQFIAKLPKDFKELFFKIETHTNAYITYFMAWDGSKEGWDTSEKANDIREQFIKIVLESYKSPTILHIIPQGDIYDEDIIKRIK